MNQTYADEFGDEPGTPGIADAIALGLTMVFALALGAAGAIGARIGRKK